MARYVTTDLHGCRLTFQHLVEHQLKLRPQDELYVLGDYVNKGPDSRGVLEYLMQLPQRGYRVHCLRGNHDQELLDAAQSHTRLTWASAADRRPTLSSFGVETPEAIPTAYLRWLHELPHQLEVPGWVLVHAGFDFRLPPVEMRQDWHTMLNTKQFIYDASRLGGYRLVHGHVPTPVAAVQQRVDARAGAIGLDTGCVYRHNPELRHLAAFNLDTEKLILQPSIEADYPIGVR